MDIVSKGQSLNIDIVSKQAAPAGSRKFYFGAGWDTTNGDVDVDLTCSMLVGGKLVDDNQFVYYGNNKSQIPHGVTISADNTTGEGEGDDEHIIIDTDSLPSDVDGLMIGLVCFSKGSDFVSVPNPHFRVCDGDNESSPQIADVPVGNASAGDTVLVGFHLAKGADGWSLTNDGNFFAKGNEVDAIKGFAQLSK